MINKLIGFFKKDKPVEYKEYVYEKCRIGIKEDIYEKISSEVDAVITMCRLLGYEIKGDSIKYDVATIYISRPQYRGEDRISFILEKGILFDIVFVEGNEYRRTHYSSDPDLFNYIRRTLV